MSSINKIIISEPSSAISDNNLLITDYEVRSLDSTCTNNSTMHHPRWYNLKYLAVGVVFGIVFVKAEVISWFRTPDPYSHRSVRVY